MSDQKTDGEIEDVLSSIRRLVSEDDPVSSNEDKGDDRLVLTAALRVDADKDKSEDAPSATSLENRVAELEAAVDEKAGQWEEEEAPEDEGFDPWEPAEAGRPEAADDGPRARVEVVTLSAAPEREGSDAPNVGVPDLESLLDEDELRALVAEVLREELKGPLGERITRNVRKLVRKEIAQALSSLDIG